MLRGVPCTSAPCKVRGTYRYVALWSHAGHPGTMVFFQSKPDLFISLLKGNIFESWLEYPDFFPQIYTNVLFSETDKLASKVFANSTSVVLSNFY